MQARNRNGLPRELTTEEHAKLAAEELRKRLAPEPCVPDGRLTPIGSILMRLSVNLRSPAMTHVVAHTLPAVRDFIAVAVKSPELFAAEDVFGALKVLVWCRQVEDVEFISALALGSFRVADPDWSRVFTRLDSQHPLTVHFLTKFESRLPGGVIDAMLLRVANCASERALCSGHLFDSADGNSCLRAFLAGVDVESAWLAARAIRWMRPEYRAELLALAENHSSRDVKVELAGTMAVLGDADGISRLVEFCGDPIFSHLAQASLKDAGAADRIPARCSEPDFEAMCEMNHWLCFPSEFGRPPAEISVVYSERLFWPPADDFCHMSLVHYVYRDVEPVDIGIGCTGSRTFAIFGVSTAELSVPELLGLYCAHEGIDDVDLSSEEGTRTAIDAGLDLLKQRNAGMFN